MNGRGVVDRSVLEEEILFITVEDWDGVFLELRTWSRAPEVDSIVSCAIDILKHALHHDNDVHPGLSWPVII